MGVGLRMVNLNVVEGSLIVYEKIERWNVDLIEIFS